MYTKNWFQIDNRIENLSDNRFSILGPISSTKVNVVILNPVAEMGKFAFQKVIPSRGIHDIQSRTTDLSNYFTFIASSLQAIDYKHLTFDLWPLPLITTLIL